MKRPRLRQKFRQRIARRLGLFPPPLRSLPCLTRQFFTTCRHLKKTPGAARSGVIFAPWPGRFAR